MAKDITLLGASYSDVPAVDLPKTGGGTARFVDPDEYADGDELEYGVSTQPLVGTARVGATEI